MASASASIPRLLSRQGQSVAKAGQNFAQEARRKATQKHAKKQAKAQDRLLRKAVELYHLTPAFFPLPARASRDKPEKNEKWEEELDQTVFSRILDTDVIARSIPNVTPRSLHEYARAQESRSSTVPELSVDREESAANRAQTAYSFASDLTRTSFMTQSERARAEQEEQRARASALPSSSIEPTLSHFTDQDIAMYQRRHEESALGMATGLDSHRYSGAERPTHLDRSTPGGTDWYGTQGLDVRSARIRDAIFGTISGELPGLEVVRERLQRMRAKKSTNPVSEAEPIDSQANPETKSEPKVETPQESQ